MKTFNGLTTFYPSRTLILSNTTGNLDFCAKTTCDKICICLRFSNWSDNDNLVHYKNKADDSALLTLVLLWRHWYPVLDLWLHLPYALKEGYIQFLMYFSSVVDRFLTIPILVRHLLIAWQPVYPFPSESLSGSLFQEERGSLHRQRKVVFVAISSFLNLFSSEFRMDLRSSSGNKKGMFTTSVMYLQVASFSLFHSEYDFLTSETAG